MRKIVRVICLLIGISALIIFCYLLYDKVNNDNKAVEEYDKLSLINEETSEEFPIDVEQLLSINSEFVAWIRVGNMIDYPVVQGEDNVHYLNYTFENQRNNSGCIFMNCDNESSFSDGNTILYGHSMVNGSMFNQIKNFSDFSVYGSVKYIEIYTVDKRRLLYEICSYQEVHYSSDNYLIANTDEEKERLINQVSNNSIHDLGYQKTITNDDKIITLSTCKWGSTRRILHGKLVDERQY
ncbi:MAG: class B sortase [Suipraeoptans sp.]